jgi:hypothetical protein
MKSRSIFEYLKWLPRSKDSPTLHNLIWPSHSVASDPASWFWISTWRFAMLTEWFHDFPQSLQENSGIITSMGQDISWKDYVGSAVGLGLFLCKWKLTVRNVFTKAHPWIISWRSSLHSLPSHRKWSLYLRISGQRIELIFHFSPTPRYLYQVMTSS